MKGRTLHLGLAAALLVPAVQGADVNRSWETLIETLKPGRKVVVVQHSRKQAEGKLLSLTSESIAIEVRGQPLTVQREDVFRVRIANIRRRNTLIGMAVGTAAGALVGIAVRSKTGDKSGVGEWALGGALLFGVGPGALVGACVPIGTPLYEAPGGLKKSEP